MSKDDNRTDHAPRLGQTRIKLNTLFRTEWPKTIPRPAARPRIGYLMESPSQVGHQINVCSLSDLLPLNSCVPASYDRYDG